MCLFIIIVCIFSFEMLFQVKRYKKAEFYSKIIL